MRIESLYPKPVRGDFATTNQVRDDAVATYGDHARDLLDRAGGDTIGAISLLYLAADQRKQAAEDEVDVEQIAHLQSIIRAVTASDGAFARLYSEHLRALPSGTVVRDEEGVAWTRVDDEDGGVWATPTEDDTLSSADLVAGSSVYLAWVADL